MKSVDLNIRDSILKLTHDLCIYSNAYIVKATGIYFIIQLPVNHSIVTNLHKLKHIKL